MSVNINVWMNKFLWRSAKMSRKWFGHLSSQLAALSSQHLRLGCGLWSSEALKHWSTEALKHWRRRIFKVWRELSQYPRASLPSRVPKSYPPNSYKLCYISKRNKYYLPFILPGEINNYLFRLLKFPHRHFLSSFFIPKGFLICLLFSSVKRCQSEYYYYFFPREEHERFTENCHRGRIDPPVSSTRQESIILFFRGS